MVSGTVAERQATVIPIGPLRLFIRFGSRRSMGESAPRFQAGVVLFPRRSSKGDMIAFIYFHSGETGTDRALYAVRPDGSKLMRITDNKYKTTEPSWSADG